MSAYAVYTIASNTETIDKYHTQSRRHKGTHTHTSLSIYIYISMCTHIAGVALLLSGSPTSDHKRTPCTCMAHPPNPSPAAASVAVTAALEAPHAGALDHPLPRLQHAQRQEQEQEQPRRRPHPRPPSPPCSLTLTTPAAERVSAGVCGGSTTS